MPLEIERKFLIRMPKSEELASFPHFSILQTYLLDTDGATRRVRMKKQGEDIRYIYTEKRRKSDMTAEETEFEITRAEYDRLCADADESRTPISKTRYVIPNAGHLYEVDLYDFWKKQATVEVELSAEDEPFEMPSFLEILREVTSDARYKNHSLAKTIPSED